MNALRAVLLLATALLGAGVPTGDAVPEDPPYTDILLGDEEASIDLAATVPSVFGLFREAAAAEFGLVVAAGDDSLPDTWLHEGELWFRAEPLDYKAGVWTRFRLRVSDFTLPEHEDRAEQLLSAMALLLEERLFPERAADAVAQPDPGAEGAAAGTLAATAYQPATGYLTPVTTTQVVTVPQVVPVYLPVWSVGWYGFCSPTYWWGDWHQPGWGVWWWAPRYWAWSWHVRYGAFGLSVVDAYPWWWHGSPWTLWGHSSFGHCACHWCTVVVVKHHDHDHWDGDGCDDDDDGGKGSGDVADGGDDPPGGGGGRTWDDGPRAIGGNGPRVGWGDHAPAFDRGRAPTGVSGSSAFGDDSDGRGSWTAGLAAGSGTRSGEAGSDGGWRDGAGDDPFDLSAGGERGRDDDGPSTRRVVGSSDERRPVSQPVARRPVRDVAETRVPPRTTPALRIPVGSRDETPSRSFSGSISTGPSTSFSTPTVLLPSSGSRAVAPSAPAIDTSSRSTPSARSSGFLRSSVSAPSIPAPAPATPRGLSVVPSSASPLPSLGSRSGFSSPSSSTRASSGPRGVSIPTSVAPSTSSFGSRSSGSSSGAGRSGGRRSGGGR